MRPKVTMKAPPGVGGHIHVSKSGKNYTIDPNGEVVVDAVDVADLITAGFQQIPHAGGPETLMAAPITSDSLTSDTHGAHALDPSARESLRREVTGSPQAHGDFGNATPPHGVARDVGGDPVTHKRKAADAALERQTAELSRKSDPAPSAEANTGFEDNPAPSKGDQERAAERAEAGEKSSPSTEQPA